MSRWLSRRTRSPYFRSEVHDIVLLNVRLLLETPCADTLRRDMQRLRIRRRRRTGLLSLILLHKNHKALLHEERGSRRAQEAGDLKSQERMDPLVLMLHMSTASATYMYSWVWCSLRGFAQTWHSSETLKEINENMSLHRSSPKRRGRASQGLPDRSFYMS